MSTYYQKYKNAADKGNLMVATTIRLEAIAAALRGNSEAAKSVGEIYMDLASREIGKDAYQKKHLLESERWFRKAAELGDREAGLLADELKMKIIPAFDPPASISPPTFTSPTFTSQMSTAGNFDHIEIEVVQLFSDFQWNISPSPIPVDRSVMQAQFVAKGAKSRPMTINANDSGSEGGLAETPPHWQNLQSFSGQLVAQGWEMYGKGRFWYSYRFRRPIG
jgi:hypothetical protein